MTTRFVTILLLLAGISLGVAFLPRVGLVSDASAATTKPTAKAQKKHTKARITKILTTKTAMLEDGRILRLASIQAPNLKGATGRADSAEPRAKEALHALRMLLEGREVLLETASHATDRHGRIVAVVRLEDGRIVQEELIRQGWALAYPFPDHRDIFPRLLQAEQEARGQQRGLWADAYWREVSAKTLESKKEAPVQERYRLMMGRVQAVKAIGGDWYLNFGEDYRTDMTAHIRKQDVKHFSPDSLAALQGKRIRLRGWIYQWNGPIMDVVMPEQIERLD